MLCGGWVFCEALRTLWCDEFRLVIMLEILGLVVILTVNLEMKIIFVNF